MLKTNYQNGHSARIGAKAERDYLSYAKHLGFNPRQAPLHIDREHIDFIMDVSGIQISVEVKGFKNSTSKGFILVEIINVQGNPGWLYGKADWIAFQMADNSFLTVDRIDLLKLIESKGINPNDKSKRTFDKFKLAPYWYQRPGRKDCITYLTLKEVQDLA
jgi:hypothetical protein